MRRTLLLVAVVVSVTIAGCSGPQSPGTPTAEPTDDTDPVPSMIPGVSNGTLTNATALATANGAGVVDDGATINVTRTTPGGRETAQLTVAAAGPTELSRTMSADGNESTVTYYTNDTATYVRTAANGETSYRVVERPFRPLEGVNSSLEAALAVGEFTVDAGATDSATVVLTADEFSTSAEYRLLDGATPRDARLVLAQDGTIQNLTVTGQRDGQTVRYTYDRRQAAVDTFAAPAWLADVPPTADLQADLTTDVVNNSALRLDHDGGDTVPPNTTLRFADNDTAGTVAFDAPFEAGDTRYAYFAASNGTLVLTADRPAADATTPLDSPASVTVSTADGVTLFSAGMGWGAESASEGPAGGAGSEA